MRRHTDTISTMVSTRMMDSFLNVGRKIYCENTRDNNQDKNICDVMCEMAVSNTNLAFACEIGLKTLAFAETKNPLFDQHDLLFLYDLLSEKSKTIIKSFTVMKYNARIINQPQMTEIVFLEMLKKNKRAFIDSRYWYEQYLDYEKEMGNLFILSFSEAISQLVNMFPYKEMPVSIISERDMQ